MIRRFRSQKSIIEAMILDYSGVMFDDRFFTLSIVNDIFRRFSIPPIDSDQFQREFKLPFYSIFVERGIPRKVVEKVVIRTYHSKYPNYSDYILPFDDTITFVRTLRSLGIRLAIASQTPRPEVINQLERFGLLPCFDSIIAYNEARAEKPDPAPLLETAERLGLLPRQILYAGDMKEDVECAKRAGVQSAAIARPAGSYHTAWMLLNACPDYIFSDLDWLGTLLFNGMEVSA